MAPNSPLNQWAQTVLDWLGRVSVTQHYGCVSGSGAQYEPVIGGCHFHQGVDLGYPAGSPALSVLPWARVDYAGRLGGYGNVVILAIPNGTRVLYGHLRQILVRPGEGVALGQQIGLTGGVPGEPGAGASTGAHLHLEVRNARGQTVNPGGVERSLGTGVFDRLAALFSYTSRPYAGQGWPSSEGGSPAGSWYPSGGTYPVAPPEQKPPGGTSGGGGTPTGQPASQVGSTPEEDGKKYGCGDKPKVPPIENEPDYIRWLTCVATKGAVGKVENGTGGIVNLLGGASGGLPFGLTGPGITFVAVGGLLLVAGLRSFTNEPAVKVVTQPIADVGGAVKRTVAVAATRGA